ncbi:MAG: hypothetical protein ABIL58_11515 [Pseudomonadota bacterium]
MRLLTVSLIVFATIAFITSSGYALEIMNYPASCEDSRYRDSLFPSMDGDCHMNIGDRISVQCRVYPEACVICRIFECMSREEAGSTLIECKETYPSSEDKKINLTEKEFLDTQTRCTKICGVCPTKWKSGKSYRVDVPDDKLK